jgi:hypothetical protein
MQVSDSDSGELQLQFRYQGDFGAESIAKLDTTFLSKPQARLLILEILLQPAEAFLSCSSRPIFGANPPMVVELVN